MSNKIKGLKVGNEQENQVEDKKQRIGNLHELQLQESREIEEP